MVKYIGPKIKIQRRLGSIASFPKQSKIFKKITPGEHGKRTGMFSRRSSLSTSYKERFIEKQKLKFAYGITEKKLLSYYSFSKNKKSSAESFLAQLLESRLDNIVFRLGFALTTASARQYISHGHINVNNNIINVPGFLCSKEDTISVKNNSSIKTLIEKNISLIKEKNKRILEKFKHYNYFKKNPLTITPKYLLLNQETLSGKIIAKASIKDLKTNINFLKIIEYYSK
jgi:small subunit ribosomal protein S4